MSHQPNNEQSTITQGVHHVGLSVPDIFETSAFFTDVLRFQKVGEKPDYPAVFLSDGTTMLTIWQLQNDQPHQSFNRHCNAGLHHFAIKVVDNATLETLHQNVSGYLGAEIEFAPEPLNNTPFRHMMCRIPGGLRLELIAQG